MNTVQKLILGTVSILFLSWLMFFHKTEAYQLGVRWNLATGKISKDEKSGYQFTPPWVLVSKIDTRPSRVCVTSASRAFSCKLVEFVPDYYIDFTETEGFRYWWWSNRISFNLGYSEEYRGLKDILRGYAYGTKKYPFVNVLVVYREGE